MCWKALIAPKPPSMMLKPDAHPNKTQNSIKPLAVIPQLPAIAPFLSASQLPKWTTDDLTGESTEKRAEAILSEWLPGSHDSAVLAR